MAMHPTKYLLIERHGLRCMLCGKEVSYHDINWHHIVPRYVSKSLGQPSDDSYENGSLLCVSCHKHVHKYDYWDKEYQRLLYVIIRNKEEKEVK